MFRMSRFKVLRTPSKDFNINYLEEFAFKIAMAFHSSIFAYSTSEKSKFERQFDRFVFASFIQFLEEF